jgi:hypothetical protein
MISSKISEDSDHDSESVVTVTDHFNRRLECRILNETIISVEGQKYALVEPVDATIEIYSWQAAGEDEDDAVLVEGEIIANIFGTAQAVLSEKNLILKDTPYVLTVAGELPNKDESTIFNLEFDDIDDEEEPERLMEIATFFHDEQEYAIYTPLETSLFLARITKMAEPKLIHSQTEEFIKIHSIIEDNLKNI